MTVTLSATTLYTFKTLERGLGMTRDRGDVDGTDASTPFVKNFQFLGRCRSASMAPRATIVGISASDGCSSRQLGASSREICRDISASDMCSSRQLGARSRELHRRSSRQARQLSAAGRHRTMDVRALHWP